MKVAVLGVGGMGATVIDHLSSCADVGEIVAYDISEERVREQQQRFHIAGTTQLDNVLSIRGEAGVHHRVE